MDFLRVYYGPDDGYVLAEAHQEPALDAAVTAYLSSGGTRDELISLTLLDGSELKLRASAVGSWYVSTPASRTRAVELEKELADELRAIRAAAGIFDE